jgi:hypothetical protein
MIATIQYLAVSRDIDHDQVVWISLRRYAESSKTIGYFRFARVEP